MAHPDISNIGDTFQIQKFNTTVVCPIIIYPSGESYCRQTAGERERAGENSKH